MIGLLTLNLSVSSALSGSSTCLSFFLLFSFVSNVFLRFFFYSFSRHSSIKNHSLSLPPSLSLSASLSLCLPLSLPPSLSPSLSLSLPLSFPSPPPLSLSLSLSLYFISLFLPGIFFIFDLSFTISSSFYFM